MQYYFAPMEGVTDSIYRDLHSKIFPGIHRYYTPFFSPTMHQTLTQKEKRELPLAESLNYTLIPQVLTKIPEDFIWFTKVCQDRGYTQINLNTGCPSGTVTAKGKGSGMLRDTDGLKHFLDQIFTQSPLPISIKTRIGYSSSEEFPEILKVFNDYPLTELIIHPRVRDQFYKGTVDQEAFTYAVHNSKHDLVYNGNLNTKEDIAKIQNAYPQVNAVMLGRGLIGDPGMVTESGATAAQLEQFTTLLLERYTEAFGSARNAMFRMKENWRHLLCKFDDSEKLGKKLRKTTDIDEFKAITAEIYQKCPLRQNLKAEW